jgi:hypothetical protein
LEVYYSVTFLALGLEGVAKKDSYRVATQILRKLIHSYDGQVITEARSPLLAIWTGF